MNFYGDIMLKQIFFFLFLFWSFYPVSGKNYYIDSREGLDTASGLSPSDSWKTLEKVNNHSFHPGDSIFFKREGIWTGELTLNSSGTENRPIIITAYDKGKDPVIKNPGIEHGVAIRLNGDWIILENFMVREAHEAGIYISNGADHNIIRNNEATMTGMGISIHGRYNLVTRNYAHDLTIIVNTPGGDDDYGAVGIWMFSSNNEVSYNRMINCRAPSLDYGYDGGVVEFYGNVDSCYIHHNWGENCNGSFEVGGRGHTLSHNVIAYNVYVNNGVSGGFHVGGKFGIQLEGMRIENNTFIDTTTADYAIGFWNGNPEFVDIQYRNNIFYIPNCMRVSNFSDFIHEYNLYYLGTGKDPGVILGKGEETGNPLFVSLEENDFHVQKDSPAFDAGIDLGYKLDFKGNQVPNGKAPEMGAFESTNKSPKLQP